MFISVKLLHIQHFKGLNKKKMSVLTDYSHNLISEDLTLNDEKSSLGMNSDHN